MTAVCPSLHPAVVSSRVYPSLILSLPLCLSGHALSTAAQIMRCAWCEDLCQEYARVVFPRNASVIILIPVVSLQDAPSITSSISK